MTSKSVNTLQYTVFFNDLNAALKLAYTVRVIKRIWPDLFQELQLLENELKQAWIERGFTADEVKANGLTELIWDLKQLGWSERRYPTEVYDTHTFNIIQQGIEPISNEVLSNLDLGRFPFIKRYRVCDLLNSINIEDTLKAYINRGTRLGNGPSSTSLDAISLSDFIAVRRPTPVVPGAYQAQRASSLQTPHIALILELGMNDSDIEAAISDFRFHFSQAQHNHGLAGEYANKIFSDWAMGQTQESVEEPISLITQIAPVLAGLTAYDKMMEFGGIERRGSRARAAKETAALFAQHDPRNDDHKVGKWLGKERQKIENMHLVFLRMNCPSTNPA